MTITKSSKKRYWYVVFAGACPGIYQSHIEARQQVDGYRKGKWKRFDSKAEAKKAFRKSSCSTYNPNGTYNWGYTSPRRR